MATITGTSGNDTLTGTGANDDLFGLEGNDILTGLGGQDRLAGGLGNDTLDGGANLVFFEDYAIYAGTGETSVTVDLALGRAEDAQGGVDTLIGIEGVSGTNGNDTLLGKDGERNVFFGMGGNDVLDGRGHAANREDFAAYNFDPAAIDGDLATGIVRDGFGGTDTLRNIEGLSGSNFNDTLRGDSVRNVLVGGAGNDIMDGRGGRDSASYLFATTAVSVNLATGVASDGQGGTDTLISIEDAGGSSFADTLLGNDGDNSFVGFGGNDAITGGAGIDLAGYLGLRSAYTITNANGVRTITDATATRDGVDTLTGIERLQFSDGVLAFDNMITDNAGRGYLIYRAAFDRTPDAAGLGYWINELDRGQDFGSVVAASFIASPEFITKYGTNTSNTQFITLVYQNVLDRAPDAAGLDYWLTQAGGGGLNGGYARSNMLASFAISNENVTAVGTEITNGIFFTPFV